MPLRIVQSKQNSRLKLLRQALARPGCNGLAVGVEGANLLSEALRSGLHASTIFVAEGSEHLVDQMTGRGTLYPLSDKTEILVLPRRLLDAAQTTEAPQPIAALIDAPQWQWSDLEAVESAHGSIARQTARQRQGPILVLAAVQDPGNLGTILRSAEAFGAAGVLSLPGTVSVWNPKTLRASAGSAFRVPVVAARPDEAFAWLQASGRRIWSTAVDEAQSVTAVDLTTPLALIIGNEGGGVAAEIAAQAHGLLTIPCPGAVESLNAAVATSILLYEVARQRTNSSLPLPRPRGAKQ